jgi:hypothetical protein
MNSARSFRSLVMVASCATAALGCYLVSLRVASERAALEAVETRIVMAQRDLRVLQTEIGTRGRLAQLERWNVKVLALSAPSADQFLSGTFELAKMTRPQQQIALEAPVVLAAAPQPVKPELGAAEGGDAPRMKPDAEAPGLSPKQMMNVVSLKTGTREVPASVPAPGGEAVRAKSKGQPALAAKPVVPRALDKPGLAAAKPATKPTSQKTVDKKALAAAKPVTKPAGVAKADPLAALPPKRPGSTVKEPARPQ